MANRDTQIVPDSRPMVGGDGAHSYASNSAYQVLCVCVYIVYICHIFLFLFHLRTSFKFSGSYNIYVSVRYLGFD